MPFAKLLIQSVCLRSFEFLKRRRFPISVHSHLDPFSVHRSTPELSIPIGTLEWSSTDLNRSPSISTDLSRRISVHRRSIVQDATKPLDLVQSLVCACVDRRQNGATARLQQVHRLIEPQNCANADRQEAAAACEVEESEGERELSPELGEQ